MKLVATRLQTIPPDQLSCRRLLVCTYGYVLEALEQAVLSTLLVSQPAIVATWQSHQILRFHHEQFMPTQRRYGYVLEALERDGFLMASEMPQYLKVGRWR